MLLPELREAVVAYVVSARRAVARGASWAMCLETIRAEDIVELGMAVYGARAEVLTLVSC